MTKQRVITTKETKTVIKCCEWCDYFCAERLFGFVPAYCKLEGRILSEIRRNAGQGGPVGVGDTWHVIPLWCPLEIIEV